MMNRTSFIIILIIAALIGSCIFFLYGDNMQFYNSERHTDMKNIEEYFNAVANGDYKSAVTYTIGQAKTNIENIANYEGSLTSDPNISIKVLNTEEKGSIRISDVLVCGQASAHMIKVYEKDGKIFKTEENSMFAAVPNKKVNDSKIVKKLNSQLSEFITALDAGNTDRAISISTGQAQKSLVYTKNIMPNLPAKEHTVKPVSFVGGDGLYLGEYKIISKDLSVNVAVIFVSLKGGVKIAEIWQVS